MVKTDNVFPSFQVTHLSSPSLFESEICMDHGTENLTAVDVEI